MSGKDRPDSQLRSMTHKHYTFWTEGDGSTTEFPLEVTVLRLDDVEVFLGGALQQPADRGTANDYAVRGLTPGYSGDSNRVRFASAPGNGVAIAFRVVGG